MKGQSYSELRKTTRTMKPQSKAYQDAAVVLKENNKRITCDHQWAYTSNPKLGKAIHRYCILCKQEQVFRTKWCNVYKGIRNE